VPGIIFFLNNIAELLPMTDMLWGTEWWVFIPFFSKQKTGEYL